MALFEDKSTEEIHFPTEPAFLVPVEVKPIPSIGEGHCGVFSKEFIPSQTKFWAWTDRVKTIPQETLKQYIEDNFTTKTEIQIFLRQGFVLPPSSTSTTSEEEDDGTTTTTFKGKEDQYFYSNPTDAGRYMNHSSSNPNCGPDGTLRDIQSGEEMTMDYTFHGNPIWYQDICNEYDVLTERQIAEKYS